MSNLSKLLSNRIDTLIRANESKQWNESEYPQIISLQSDTIGVLGEEFIEELLVKLNHKVERNAIKDRTRKHWDIKVDSKIKCEIKTATLGKNGNFQHENIEKDRDFDALILLDIAPKAIYLTVAPKETLPFTVKDNIYTKNEKKMHRRAHGIQYKWDLSLRDLEDREVKTLKDAKNIFEVILN